jgi:hypothetical protein
MQENMLEINNNKFIRNIDTLKALKYGYMDISLHKESLNETFLTKYLDDFSSIEYPQLYDTYQEIEQLKRLQKKVISSPKLKTMMKFFRDCDEDIHKVFEKEFKVIGVKYNGDFLQNIQDELGGLVLRLKNHYSRPRPFQFAYYGEQNFHPFPTLSGNSPSYPSGHACQSHFLMEVMAHRNPSKRKSLRALAKKIADTRIAMGIHYPSDNDFGKKIAMTLKDYPEVRDRYFKRIK